MVTLDHPEAYDGAEKFHLLPVDRVEDKGDGTTSCPLRSCEKYDVPKGDTIESASQRFDNGSSVIVKLTSKNPFLVHCTSESQTDESDFVSNNDKSSLTSR
jgi:hypothetical protein